MNTKRYEHDGSLKISTGKKILLFVVFCSIAFVQQSFAQTNSTPGPSELLASYYNVKDALIADDANSAAANAEKFVKTINSISSEIIHESKKDALLKDASAISATKDLKKQRATFSTFSVNMFALTKELELNTEPVYYAYCPMVKATWLSSNKTIKNPYYGSVMLTCGKVTETIE